jgi:DNA-binding CsgD family transcriptional regulator/tetratricopeptide (TPR) repeat protein
MTLLERESSLASLAEYAREARRGEGRLVLVAGEAGVGKSALVERLEHEVRDARWSWGACDGLFTPRPLGPLFDLAAQLGGELAELCRAGAAREELFGALLRQVNEPGTLNVVVVEDVHWADEATVDLLRFLGRRLRSSAVLLIATYRDESLTPSGPLRLALGDLAVQRSTRRVWLAPLSEGAVRIMAAGTGFDAAELYRLTGGNPFYVTEVVQAGIGAVPASARDAVLARVARLSGESRDLVDVAALIGTRIEMRLLESAAECAPAAVDELVASGLFAADGGWLKFRHEIARLAVEQAIAPHRRGVIHTRILAALRLLGCDDDAQLAFHAEAAGDGAAVMRYAPAAARGAAALGSHREAAAQFERALRFAPQTDPALVAGLYEGLAFGVSLVDRWADAADAGQRALELWRAAGDPLREGDALRKLSRTMWRLCRGREAVEAAQAAVAILEPLGPSTELASAYSGLAAQRMLAGEPDAAIELAAAAQAIAEPLGEFEVLSDALDTEGCAASDAGREWAGQLRRALQIAISKSLPEQAGRAFTNLYSIHCGHRQFAEAERYFADGIAYCDEHDISTFARCLRGERTGALDEMGRWDESVALSLELLRDAGASLFNRMRPLISLGKIRARRGEAGVWDCLDEATAAAEGSGEPQWIVATRLARAEACWLDGKPDAAQREVQLADDISGRCHAWLRGSTAAWLRRITPGRSPRGEFAGPYRAQLEGDWELAARTWTELGCPFEAALALLDADQEAPLRDALGIFTGLGASAAARITRQRMRQLGIRSIPAGPRTATRAHPAGLTRRELEVLGLICGGYTNAEIAARLFISAKTVDHHVSAVLAKLGAPTRNVAASQAVKLGLVGAAEI